MPKMHVVTSILISKPIEEVYSILNDFNHWSTWSPWLIIEKGVKVNVSDDNKFYEWEGDLVGSGNMQITSEEINKSIDIDLTFLKPWKSKAKVRIELKKVAEEVEVKWIMDSKLPFFLFFMTKMMSTYIRMDFDRGLNLLKDYIQDGEVHSKLEFPGKKTYNGCKYIGIKTTCAVSEVGDRMSKDFEKLMSFFDDKREIISAEPLSIYHVWNPVKDKVEYTCCVPVNQEIKELPNGFVTGTIPKMSAHVVEHTGTYNHIGNAWSAQISRERSKKFKKVKKGEPFEVYLNSPKDTAPNNLRTDVYFPVVS